MVRLVISLQERVTVPQCPNVIYSPGHNSNSCSKVNQGKLGSARKVSEGGGVSVEISFCVGGVDKAVILWWYFDQNHEYTGQPSVSLIGAVLHPTGKCRNREVSFCDIVLGKIEVASAGPGLPFDRFNEDLMLYFMSSKRSPSDWRYATLRFPHHL